MPVTNSDEPQLGAVIEQAKSALGTKTGEAKALCELGKALKKFQKFNLARRVFELASKQEADQKTRRKIIQQQASCTEKDPDLPLDRRYKGALEIIAPVLAEAEEFRRHSGDSDAEQSEDIINAHQETFGIAGAIHKRWWQADTQVRHLVEAKELYEKGWLLVRDWPGPGIPDQGYTGINAAFVLDLLAQQMPDDPALVEQRKQKAREIRMQIRSRLSAVPESERSDWWSLATLAEACFGLRDYDGAREWLKKLAETKPPERWEYETTVKQLARLAMIQNEGDHAAEEFAASKSWSVLRDLVGADQAGLLTAFSGKVGLALSGGGFRASLFHIGVLARLAELDMLRHVEVLSCVSGGSIIGALYYLKVRALLERHPDKDIKCQDYIDVVKEMEQTFMAGIQGNPRMQVFSKLLQLARRTEEMGRLLDDTLYGPAAGLSPDLRPELRELRICPPANEEEVKLPTGQRSPFVPKYDNWRRAHKIPILIINATALNTGHNWQFTASFMGESPNQIVPEVDGNERLRRMYFDESMPEKHRTMPLGLAVAASAAVPGLFRPVSLTGLYPGRDIELVDGGVHDNQGIGGLLEQECTVIFVSDASGQLVAERKPARLETSVLSRSNNTLMSRVRELEFRELTARKEAGLLRDTLFVHLKKDLAVEPVDWLECDLAKEARESEGTRPNSTKPTSYGVRGDVQNMLAGIRTDLDAFSEAEAYALMNSGYRMTTHYFSESITSFKPNATLTTSWPFQMIQRFMSSPDEPGTDRPEPCQVTDFLARLTLAARLLFKAPQLLPYFPQLSRIIRVCALVGLCLAFALPMLAIVMLLWRVPILLLALGLGLIVLGAIVLALAFGGLYQITSYFDRFYLRKGSLAELLRAPPRSRTQTGPSPVSK
jgi:predicted acylesterase/phospholipase RssA